VEILLLFGLNNIWILIHSEGSHCNVR